MNIQEGNKLIGEFMGFDYKKETHYNLVMEIGEQMTEKHLQYHSSWDWLMPVVEKISRIEFDRQEEELPMGGTQTVIHTHYPRTFGMLSQEGKPMFRFNRCGLHIEDSLITATWKAVVDFIEMVHEQQKSKA